MTLKRSSRKIQSAFVEFITHRKPSNESFKMGARSQIYELEPSDNLRRDNHSAKLCQRIALELTWKKKVARTVRHPIKVNVWGCFSSKGFDRIIPFKQNLSAKLMCDISKRGFLPSVRKQFGHDSALWKLQEDNEPKHTSTLAASWKRKNGVHEIN